MRQGVLDVAAGGLALVAGLGYLMFLFAAAMSADGFAAAVVWALLATVLTCVVNVMLSFAFRPSRTWLLALLFALPTLLVGFISLPDPATASGIWLVSGAATVGVGWWASRLFAVYAGRRALANPTPHPDARDLPAPASDSAARAGGRER